MAQETHSPLVLDWAPLPTRLPQEPPRTGRCGLLAMVSGLQEQKGGGSPEERWPRCGLVGDLPSAREMQDIPFSGEEAVLFLGRGPMSSDVGPKTISPKISAYPVQCIIVWRLLP